MIADEMYSRASLLTQLVASSVSIGKLASRRIIETVGTDLGSITKEDHRDLQTKADRISQQIIVNSLKRKFGADLTVIGEEDGLINDNFTDEFEPGHDAFVLAEEKNCPENLKHINLKDITVWVDPLDGTSEFAEGLLEHATVLIGIALNKSPVAGVMSQPFYGYSNPDVKKTDYGRVIWSIEGLGVRGIGVTPPPKGKLIITTTRSHSNKAVLETIEALKPDEVLRVGGAGHKVLLLLEGKAHAYVFASKGCKKWDTCAPEAILTALGGKLGDLFGNAYEYHSSVGKPNLTGVLATAVGVDHQALLDKIPQNVKSGFV